jgi:hypothetical protein
MADDALITVARYATLGAAHLAQAQLQDAGVPCQIEDASLAGQPMMFDAGRSGAKLRVPAAHAEEARSVLELDAD